MNRLRLGILISGRGSNMAALLDACADPAYPAEVALVISNRADAAGLDRAEASGAATRVIDHRGYDGRAEFDAALTEALAAADVELVCLAGFMRLLSAGFVEHWQDRLINIHPSLLPAFKGLDVHGRVLAAGVRVSGATVHFVRAEMDDGPILAQAAVPVLAGDGPGRLAARVLEVEHRIYPLAVRLIAEGRTRIVDGRVEIEAAAVPDGVLINPAPE